MTVWRMQINIRYRPAFYSINYIQYSCSRHPLPAFWMENRCTSAPPLRRHPMCSTCPVSLVLVCEHKDPVPCALYKAWVIGFAPLVHVSVFVLVPHCFCCDISVIQLQIWNTNPSSTVFFLCPTPRIILDILGLLWFHMNSASMKNVVSMIGITLNLNCFW